MYFNEITQQVKSGRGWKLTSKEWGSSESMCMVRLNSQVQYGGFTHGRRVFGRTAEMPIGAMGNPNFKDFTFRNAPPVIQARDLVTKLRMVRRGSLERDFRAKFNLAMRRSFRDIRNEQFLLWGLYFAPDEITKINRAENGLARVSL